MQELANYCLVDATLLSDAPELLDQVTKLSLYKGDSVERLAAFAPYILPIDENSALSALVERYKEKMVFLFAPVDLTELQRHLRKFLIVRDHTSKQLYFRFYDPFVLGVLLPTCTAEQFATFFGPIDAIWVNNENDRSGDIFDAFRRSEFGQRLRTERRIEFCPLASIPAAVAAADAGG